MIVTYDEERLKRLWDAVVRDLFTTYGYPLSDAEYVGRLFMQQVDKSSNIHVRIDKMESAHTTHGTPYNGHAMVGIATRFVWAWRQRKPQL